MLTEELVSAVGGPPIAANTAVPKDVGIYNHTVAPAWRLKASFKKSSIGPNCLAVSDNHVFAAQDQKAHVHVYSRQRGNQETLVSFQERIRSVALAGNVLLLGTAEGRLILWEVGFFFITPKTASSLTLITHPFCFRATHIPCLCTSFLLPFVTFSHHLSSSLTPQYTLISSRTDINWPSHHHASLPRAGHLLSCYHGQPRFDCL